MRQEGVLADAWKQTDENCDESLQCKACCHVLNTLSKDHIPTILLFGGYGTYCFVKKMSRDHENEKSSPVLEKFLRESQSAATEPVLKKAKTFPFWHISVESAMVETVD